MPRMDGTGPMGAGTLTGRGFGPCGGGQGFGCGRGRGNGMGRGMMNAGQGYGRGIAMVANQNSDPKELLIQRRDLLKSQLDALNKTIENE